MDVVLDYDDDGDGGGGGIKFNYCSLSLFKS